jgi:hypothetical protein
LWTAFIPASHIRPGWNKEAGTMNLEKSWHFTMPTRVQLTAAAIGFMLAVLILVIGFLKGTFYCIIYWSRLLYREKNT